MATCTEALWDVEHGRFYAAIQFPAIGAGFAIRDVVLRVDGERLVVEPPACVVWGDDLRDEAGQAAVKYLRGRCPKVAAPSSKEE